MKYKKLVTLSLSIAIATIASAAHSKKIYPAEIIGRDLNYPGLGRLGHVGITTTDMTSLQDMEKDADQVIEILNENPVGQINAISHFKSRSKYWGSKYGVADRNLIGYQVLAEANHQRWWCPKYTSDTKYHIGSGNPTNGQINECGTWRCDTYVWWAFYSQGLDTMPGRIWLPKQLFNYFPYDNDETFTVQAPRKSLDMSIKKSLENITVEALNVMPYEEFQIIMDAPPAHYVTSPSSVQVQFAYDSNLTDVKRGIMIDRLIADDIERDLVKQLLNLYSETNSIEIKNKITQDLMLYNQQHRNIKAYLNHEQPLLKAFFSERLDSKSLNSKMADDAIRGFIDTHSPEEIITNRDKIDKWLPITGHYSSIMLKYTLVHQSKELQHIYIQSIIDELRKANNSDLDSYLFGPLSMGYQSSGKNLLMPESKQVVINYLKTVHYKYTLQGIKKNSTDSHRITTAPYYFELIKNMGI
ncbi:MAG: hypothetical protein QNK11_08505 [Legionella sp.]|nr:hypothetical protein [Legionella sp.]